jgi:hypothetical protein
MDPRLNLHLTEDQALALAVIMANYRNANLDVTLSPVWDSIERYVKRTATPVTNVFP